MTKEPTREIVERDAISDLAVPCCMGSAMNGPSGCTCWRPVYDREQSDELLVARPSEIRAEMCEDCAYRAGSPEMADDRRDHLRSLNKGEVFYCHQGIRRPAFWVHEERGWKLAADPSDYAPPIEGNRPFRADGTPAATCAGFAAMHRLKSNSGSEISTADVALRDRSSIAACGSDEHDNQGGQE